jgi:hypothetical protein
MRNVETADRLRAHAEECLRLAELSPDPETKQRWPALADEWLDMAAALRVPAADLRNAD